MKYKSLNHYGYDKSRYDDCIDLIHDTNYNHILIINTWFMILTVVFMVFSRLNRFGVDKRHFRMYLIYAVISLLFEIILIAFKSFAVRFAQFFTHLNILTLMTFSIYASITQPYLAATMYLVLVVLVAVTYIDTMLSMTIVLILYSCAFLYTSNLKKPVSIAQLDFYNVTVFLILAIVLHFTFQRAKMQEFYTLQKNIQIQRDLEIRSSFDTLTNLLNRARFFSVAGEVVRGYDGNEFIAACLLDLDSFKQINDKLGHQMGDKAIQVTGSIIAETLSIDMMEKWSFTERAVRDKLSFAGRLGGDEFIMVIRGREKNDIKEILESILKKLNNVRIGELQGIHGSFGVTVIKPADRDMDSAYNRADDALYESKRAGKNRITFDGGN
ncbi:MAG: GGDEF domain-containing protein [Lachnospiraceae bacterium]|nr:GGDEF domain-containing protein [Lachnospiraceae bacterium]